MTNAEELPGGSSITGLERVSKMQPDILEDFIVHERRSWPPKLLVELELGVQARRRELDDPRS